MNEGVPFQISTAYLRTHAPYSQYCITVPPTSVLSISYRGVTLALLTNNHIN